MIRRGKDFMVHNKPLTDGWFSEIVRKNIRSDYRWLTSFKDKVDSVIIFGPGRDTHSIEFFSLMYVLNPSTITLVDKDQDALSRCVGNLHKYQNSYSELQNKEVQCIHGDMTSPIPELTKGTHDLAYCKAVLKQLVDLPYQNNNDNMFDEMCQSVELKIGIQNMTNSIRQHGYIIADEYSLASSCKNEIESLLEEAGLQPTPFPASADNEHKSSFLYKKA